MRQCFIKKITLGTVCKLLWTVCENYFHRTLTLLHRYGEVPILRDPSFNPT